MDSAMYHPNISLYEVDPIFFYYLNRARSNFQKCNVTAMWKKIRKLKKPSQVKAVGYILLQYSHIILQEIAYQFLLNKLHINQKLNQIHNKSSIRSNLHFIPKATIANPSGLIQLIMD